MKINVRIASVNRWMVMLAANELSLACCRINSKIKSETLEIMVSMVKKLLNVLQKASAYVACDVCKSSLSRMSFGNLRIRDWDLKFLNLLCQDICWPADIRKIWWGSPWIFWKGLTRYIFICWWSWNILERLTFDWENRRDLESTFSVGLKSCGCLIFDWEIWRCSLADELERFSLESLVFECCMQLIWGLRCKSRLVSRLFCA